MHTSSPPWLFLALCAAAAPACHDSSSSGAPGAPAPINVGISAQSVQGEGRLLLLRVRELDEGARDLNGDGDASDSGVAHVYDLETGRLTNLGLALGDLITRDVVADELAVLAVSEAAQGDTDLNGDGDALDQVAHVYDRRTGLSTNLGLAVGDFLAPVVADDFVALVVFEASQGADLDGDGATDGRVLHVYDARTGQTHNVGLQVTQPVLYRDGQFAFTTGELPRHDLNGDGDALDGFVPRFYEPVQQTVTGLPLALMPNSLFGTEAWIALVDEDGQGQDLDGDGDQDAGVYHRLEPASGQWTTLRLTGRSPTLAASSTVTGTQRAVLLGSELDGRDRDGDGSFASMRLVLHQLDTGLNLETGLPVSPAVGVTRLALAGQILAVPVSELLAGDLDGDGVDALDFVLHLVDLGSGAVKNLGVDLESLYGSTAGLVFARSERDGDLNGDGDQDDGTLHVWLASTNEVRNTGIVGDVLDVQDEDALLWGFEFASHRDWNGDGDQLDVLLLRYHLPDHTLTALAPWSFDSLENTRLGAGGRLIHLASEDQLGVDLNGDGDTADLVLQVGAPTGS